MLKVAFVSSIRPETNYSAYLIEALQKGISRVLDLLVYTDKEKENLNTGLRNVKLVWDRDWVFIFQILSQAFKDKINIIHFQHEINMYGGPRTAALFPILVLLTRILGFNPIVTIHAAVPRKDLNEDFLRVFGWPKPQIFTSLVRLVFPIIYFLIGLSAKRIIVHSQGLKRILAKDYLIDPGKTVVIPHGVPENIAYDQSVVRPEIREMIKGKKFLFYFGYFHRRKGLEVLIRAFTKVSQRYPDLFLVLGGGTVMPEYIRELKDLVRRLSLSERVFFTGFLGIADLRFLLEHCGFVVLPAIYSVAASGPLSQVFAHEKTAIVSDLGVYHEEIEDGVNGLLAKVGDSEDLANKMVTLSDGGEAESRIRENVRQIKSERAWSKVAVQTFNLYRSV